MAAPETGGPGGAPRGPDREPGSESAEREPERFAIRPIRAGDEEGVVALWRACGLTRPWNDPRKDIEWARAGASSQLFVAVDERLERPAITGSVMAGFDGHRGWVYYLAVDPARQSRGLGRRLLRHAERWLGGLGAPKVMLMIRKENDRIRGFYEHLGYGVEKRTVMSRWVRADAPSGGKVR